ncbi:MAG: P-loop NTPase fold protein, partial [Terriglobia bacterium]
MTAPPLIDINADPALSRALDIAAFVGQAESDTVNVSYSSLFIGLLWTDDPTSVWLERRLDARADGGSAIFKGRKIDRGQRGSILGLVDSGRSPSPHSDPLSISARTVLEEARSLATEANLPADAPLGTRHVAAVYFFRNPPGHNTQFHSEWGFEKEEWRRAFARFIEKQYPSEAPAWAQVLSGYVSTQDPVDERLPGSLFGSYAFDNEAVLVLRTLEFLSSLKTPAYLGSAGLLDTLAGARSVPDGAAFADLAADRLGIKIPWISSPNSSPFGTAGISLQISRGLKKILDMSRSMARSTTGTAVVGVRHLIASILVDPGSSANQKLVTSGLSLPMLRERLLKTFSRRWLNDDGLQWRQILVGSTIPTVTDINPDSADKGDDRLNVTRYARAFATLIAADRVSPPLSVGIFGDWGSGKSFFMRLMSEHTQAVAAFEDRGSDGKRLFCRNVVSIRFNAWHYAETELLASLVQTILLGLREAIVGKGGEDSDLMDKVLAKLEIAKIARSEAEARLDAARAEQMQSEILLNQAQEEADEKA